MARCLTFIFLAITLARAIIGKKGKQVFLPSFLGFPCFAPVGHRLPSFAPVGLDLAHFPQVFPGFLRGPELDTFTLFNLFNYYFFGMLDYE